ncbi:MAG: bifunctional oligoribonuclease/PAP phosphatase NrnA [Acholeplasmatales bacterium]|jgi:phosphoesterase RecJ-like protein|nr:bifunctional oligoribonuclease/PAP phosphatase NrnA [Acholeplasmatales bacterium]
MNKVLGNKILNKIKEYDNIFIFGHIRPDGDCYGSQFGLQEIIKYNFPKKKVFVITDKCDYVAFLGSGEEIDEQLLVNGLAICVDTGNASRVSNQAFLSAMEIIKIDHHEPEDHYGNINYELPDYPATCQIITEIAMELGLKVNKAAARALFVGIVTDTGWFHYRGVTELTFQCAGFLTNNGVEVDEISDKLGGISLNELRFKGVVIDLLKWRGGFLYCVLTKEIIEKYGLTDEQASNCVNYFSQVEGFPIWALIIENQNGNIRIRLRSNGINVVPLAHKYQGGGHEMAVGAKLANWNELENFINDGAQTVEDSKK